MIDMLCAGVNTYLVCAPINGAKMNVNDIKLPREYQDWAIEKAIYSPGDDKLYVQISYKNLRKIVTL